HEYSHDLEIAEVEEIPDRISAALVGDGSEACCGELSGKGRKTTRVHGGRGSAERGPDGERIDEHGVVERPDAKRAADVERWDVEPPVPIDLRENEVRDQKAAQDEKERDTEASDVEHERANEMRRDRRLLVEVVAKRAEAVH